MIYCDNLKKLNNVKSSRIYTDDDNNFEKLASFAGATGNVLQVKNTRIYNTCNLVKSCENYPVELQKTLEAVDLWDEWNAHPFVSFSLKALTMAFCGNPSEFFKKFKTGNTLLYDDMADCNGLRGGIVYCPGSVETERACGIDRKSAYASILCNYQMPVMHYETRRRISPNDIALVKISKMSGIALNNMPPVWQDSLTGDNVKIINEFLPFYIWSDELYYLENFYMLRYEIESVYYWHTWKKINPVIKHVKKYYAIKESTDDPNIKRAAKMLYTTLTGMFARHQEDTYLYDPVWYSRICAIGRIEWYKKVRRLVKQGNQILYGDTDSIFFVGKITKNMTGNNMGDFAKVFENAHLKILGPKAYIYQEEGKEYTAKVRGIPQEVIKSTIKDDPFRLFAPNTLFKWKKGDKTITRRICEDDNIIIDT